MILQTFFCLFSADKASGGGGVMLITHFQLVSRLRMSGAISLLPSTLSWREHGHHLWEPDDILTCGILASHSGVGEDSDLLGYYTT